MIQGRTDTLRKGGWCGREQGRGGTASPCKPWRASRHILGGPWHRDSGEVGEARAQPADQGVTSDECEQKARATV